MKEYYNSDYEVRLDTLKALGGDADEKKYDSVYEVDLAILKATEEGGGGLKPEVVEVLPETGEEGKMYFVPNASAGEKDNYKEYIWVNDQWENVGNADVDLTGYYLKVNSISITDELSEEYPYPAVSVTDPEGYSSVDIIQNGTIRIMLGSRDHVTIIDATGMRINNDLVVTENAYIWEEKKAEYDNTYAKKSDVPTEEEINDIIWKKQNGEIFEYCYLENIGDNPVEIKFYKWAASTSAVSKTAALNMKYSFDKIEWYSFGNMAAIGNVEAYSDAINLEPGKRVYLKGSNTGFVRTGSTTLYKQLNRFVLTGDTLVRGGGNILSLLFNDNFVNNRDLTSFDGTAGHGKAFTNAFGGVKQLVSTPILWANKLGIGTYDGAFYNCTNLKEITSYIEDFSAKDSLKEWVVSVSSTGTFYNLGKAELPTGTSGIPTGWTVKNATNNIIDDANVVLTSTYSSQKIEDTFAKKGDISGAKVVNLTQDEYDALETYDEDTFYNITDAPKLASEEWVEANYAKKGEGGGGVTPEDLSIYAKDASVYHKVTSLEFKDDNYLGGYIEMKNNAYNTGFARNSLWVKDAVSNVGSQLFVGGLTVDQNVGGTMKTTSVTGTEITIAGEKAATQNWVNSSLANYATQNWVDENYAKKGETPTPSGDFYEKVEGVEVTLNTVRTYNTREDNEYDTQYLISCDGIMGYECPREGVKDANYNVNIGRGGASFNSEWYPEGSEENMHSGIYVGAGSPSYDEDGNFEEWYPASIEITDDNGEPYISLNGKKVLVEGDVPSTDNFYKKVPNVSIMQTFENYPEGKITLSKNGSNKKVKLSSSSISVVDEQSYWGSTITNTGMVLSNNASGDDRTRVAINGDGTIQLEGPSARMTINSKRVLTVESLTQAEYDALATKSDTTLYIITDAE